MGTICEEKKCIYRNNKSPNHCGTCAGLYDKPLKANKEPVAEVPCSVGLGGRFSISDKIVEEAAMDLDAILSAYLDMSAIKKPGSYSKSIRRWIANTLNEAL